MKFKLINLIRMDCLWTSNGYRDQTKDFDIPASQKDWTKYPDSSWAGVLVDPANTDRPSRPRCTPDGKAWSGNLSRQPEPGYSSRQQPDAVHPQRNSWAATLDRRSE